jgi:hypothetical protein
MYLVPCWTTTVRGYAIVPVFGLTCTSLIAQGANECIGNDHAQSHSEGENITIPRISCLLAYSTPFPADPARVFAAGVFRRASRGPKGARRQWELYKHKLNQAEHVSFYNISCQYKRPSSIYPLRPHADCPDQMVQCASGRDWS